MHTSPLFLNHNYVPEHVQPQDNRLYELKAEVDAKNLTEMWDLILRADYQVGDAQDLPRETREEFYRIVSLLVKAFSR
ncbi:MAG: hypothetical protein JJ902_03575 [Roseibium sp.]|nr:hypothetical protein [Roseibium sp.]